MDNLEIFQGYDKKYKNQLVMEHFDVVLFKGMILNREDDYWYELLKYGEHKSYLFTGVARVTFLKDVLSKDAYDYYVSVWNYNNDTKAE